MLSEIIPIINKLGLHARAAAKFVSLASQFSCEIEVERNNRRVNGKSIMGLMMLAASHGTTLTVTAEGSDATDAVNELEDLVNRNFEEE